VGRINEEATFVRSRAAEAGMTLVDTPSPAPSAPEDKTGGAGKSAPRPASRIGRAVWTVASTAILILAATMLGFGVWLVAGSRLHYDRAQHDDYARLRAEIAQGTAPAGATQPRNPSKLLTLGTPAAVLTIPQIGLNAVVLEGTTGQVLEDGPGHLRDTPLPGQAGISVIMGRRASYGGPFARISSMIPGSIFTIRTGAGVSRYRVLDVRRPGDPVPPVPAGAGRLILATADGYPFAPTGVLNVDANLMSVPKGAPPVVISAAGLLPGEKALGSDSAAVVPMVLWAEALVLAAVALSWLGSRWGRWQTRIIAIPVLGYLGLAVADQVTRLLPNLM
jgi:sortase A